MNLPVWTTLLAGLTTSLIAAAPQSALDSGNQLMEAGKYCEALKLYRDGLKGSPSNEELLYNGGLAALQCRDFTAALDFLGRLEKIDPKDWQVHAKLIQTYQALNKTAERDAERTQLFEMRKRGGNQELSGQTQYCRDRFDAAGERVMVFEFFELTGDRAVRYLFDIMNPTGNDVKYRISLGSYDSTNQMWHETTKPAPPPEARLFHLDAYWESNHATYGMFPTEPTYDEVRALVVKILSKETKPMSATVVTPESPKAPKLSGDRAKVVQMARSLETDPLSKDAPEMRKQVTMWLIQVPDITVKACNLLPPLMGSRKDYANEIWGQLIVSQGAFLIEHPEKADDSLAVQTAALEGSLRAYESILKQKPKAKWPFLDDLLEKREKGLLGAYVQQVVAQCK